MLPSEYPVRLLGAGVAAPGLIESFARFALRPASSTARPGMTDSVGELRISKRFSKRPERFATGLGDGYPVVAMVLSCRPTRRHS
jgi:hypothetical protein